MARQVTVIVRPAATDDLRSAARYYSEIDPDLGDAFRRDFERVVDRLELFPSSGPLVGGASDIRRVPLRRFPQAAFYRLGEQDEVRILRVLHARQDLSAVLTEAD